MQERWRQLTALSGSGRASRAPEEMRRQNAPPNRAQKYATSSRDDTEFGTVVCGRFAAAANNADANGWYYYGPDERASCGRTARARTEIRANGVTTASCRH